MGNSNSHQITPETANQVVFGQRSEMSPLETLELINNLEKQINTIVQNSNIALVRVDDGIAVSELDQQLRQSKIIRRLDEDIEEKLVQIQLQHIRKYIHRDIFTTYTSDHKISPDFPAFSETYLVDRDTIKLPSVAAYKLRLQQKEEERQIKLKKEQEQQRLDQLHQQKQKPIIKSTSNSSNISQTGRVEATRQSRFNGPYQYVPREASPLGNNKTHRQHQSHPQQSQQQQPILPLPTARQTLPPPTSSAQSYADLYNTLIPPISDSLSNTDSSHSNRSSTIFSSADENTNVTAFSNDKTNNTLANLLPPPMAPIKQEEHNSSGWLPAPDSPDFAESQKKHYMSLMSYLEPPSSNNNSKPPFSPYTESIYSEFSVPDSIVDMSKFPEYRSHYINHYTPSGFQVVLNNDDIVSERAPSEAGDLKDVEVSDVETIKEPVAPESPSLTEVFAQHAKDGTSFTLESTKIEQRMSMIMQEVKPLVIREKASVIEKLQPTDSMSTVQPIPSPESLPMPSPHSPLLSGSDIFVDANSPPLTYDDLLNRTTVATPISVAEKPMKHVVIQEPSPVLSPVPTLTPADSPVPELVASAVNNNNEDNDNVIIIVPESSTTATPLQLSIPEQVEATDRAMVLPFLELEQKNPTSVVVAEQPNSKELVANAVSNDRRLAAKSVVLATPAVVTGAVAVVRKKSTAPPPKKFRWSFNLFSSSNKKKSKTPAGKHTKTKSMPNGASTVKRVSSVQGQRSSTKRSGSIRRSATPMQRMGSIKRQSSVHSAYTVFPGSYTAAIAGAAMKRNESLRRNGSCKRASSVSSTISTGSHARHRKTAFSPANSVSSFDFKQQQQHNLVSRRPSAARGAQRYRHNVPARAAGSIVATSRPYRGSVYPIQPQPQTTPAPEYRMYTSKSGTLRRKVSDISIASKLRDINGDKTLLGQGIPPKVPLHSAKSLRRRGTGIGVAAAAAISADQLVSATASHEQDTDKAMYDTQIYTRKCTFKRANKSATDVCTEAKEEKKDEILAAEASSSSPLLPKSASQFMLSGYEESSTRLKVVNRHNESALTTPQLGTTSTNTSVTAANLAHEFHSQNKLMASPNPALLQVSAYRDKDQASVRSMATTDTLKIQSKTNESLARAKKYFSWGPLQQQQVLEAKKKQFMVPATNPLPDAKICDSPRLTSDAAGKRHTVLGTPGNVGKGYFFGLDILGTMDPEQVSTAGALSPTIRVVGRKSDVEEAKDDVEENETDESLFESLQNRRSIHLADAVEQSNRLWADRGALFYEGK
ncbi:hypothetical protein D0Z03_001542 [Geotrichum reessii]|nr:hypothetical protein D0Z03_001542 [Galactomyces reessii]